MSCGCNFKRNEDDCITNAGFSYMVLMAFKSLGEKEASRQQVFFKIKSMFGDHFHQTDKDKFDKQCDGARRHLVDRKVLEQTKIWGIWTLTEFGWATLDDLLADLTITAWASE